MKVSKKIIADYLVEDFLKDESFIDWIRSGKKKEELWENHLKDYPELLQDAILAEEVISKISFREDDQQTYRIKRIKNSIDASIGKTSSGAKNGNRNTVKLERRSDRSKNAFYYKTLGAAAAVAMIISTIFVLKMNPKIDIKSNPETITKVTSKGQKLTVHLTDGSTVKMNSSSSIKYNKFFTDSSRTVHLSGEAFFEVARDADRPFRVVTENTITTALGTSFNVSAFDLNNSNIVSLKSGTVSVENKSDSDNSILILEAGQQAVFKDDQLSKNSSFDPDLLTWKDGVLTFKKDSYQNVFTKLENWYGIKFQINLKKSNNSNWDYTGRFENETLENILKSIGYVKKFTFEIKKEEVIVNLI